MTRKYFYFNSLIFNVITLVMEKMELENILEDFCLLARKENPLESI